MALRKGRSVTRAERPIYDALADMLHGRRIHFFSVPQKGRWEVWTDGPGEPDDLHAATFGAPTLVLSDVQAAAFAGLESVAKQPNRTIFSVKTNDLDGLDPEYVKSRLAQLLDELKMETV